MIRCQPKYISLNISKLVPRRIETLKSHGLTCWSYLCWNGSGSDLANNRPKILVIVCISISDESICRFTGSWMKIIDSDGKFKSNNKIFSNLDVECVSISEKDIIVWKLILARSSTKEPITWCKNILTIIDHHSVN